MVSNLFGTLEQARFLFRDTWDRVRRMIELKIDPQQLLRRPTRYLAAPWIGLTMLPRRCSRGPVLAHETTIGQLPQLKSWPDDGGAFVTLPQVYTENVEQPGLMKSNLGMYRIQLSGGRYEPDREIGMHYQLHRTIGVHHAAAIRHGKPFRVNVFVGGTPAMTLAAVMPLPEGMSELTFAGALAGHRIPMICPRPAGRDAAICKRRRSRCRSTPRPISASRERSIPTSKLPGRPVRRSFGVLQPGARFPRASRRTRLSPRRRDLAVHGGGPAAARGHGVRRTDP